MKQLHPNAVTAFYISGVVGFLFLFGLVDFVIGVPLIATAIDESFILGIPIFFAILFITTAISFALPYPIAQLSYQNFRYQLQDNQIVIERGIIWKRHVSIPYSRIQNVDIIRGPISRYLGLSDIQIQTAGISGAMLVEGRIPAVSPEEAENIKNEVLSKLKSTSQGL